MVDKALEQKDENQEDPDVARLRSKAQGGILDIIAGALEEPEVKKIINRTIIKQSLESGVFLTCLIVGVLTLVNAVKVVTSVSWQIDLVSGISLIIIGAIYIIRRMKA